MEHFSFGNLMDWGTVLEKLDRLSKTGDLDHCQEELIRLLRFDQNWRLREAAIASALVVGRPDPGLAGEMLHLVKRRDLYYDARILAADCLAELAGKMVGNRTFERDLFLQFVQDMARDLEILLASPEPPRFTLVVEKTLNRIREIHSAI